jgi:valyl-tRNA synthetase
MVIVLSVLNRLFAPFLPFVTEEVWSWWQEGSVHRAPWPDAAEIAAAIPARSHEDPNEYEQVSELLGEIRKRKAEARLSPAAPLDRVVVRTDQALGTRWSSESLTDLKSAARAASLEFEPGAAFEVSIAPAETRA